MPRVGPFTPLTPEARAKSLERTLAGRSGAVWVFAYGSLIWQPAFTAAESQPACLPGFQRAFCVWSAHARGTPDNPGLGLAVVRNAAASCEGVAIKTGVSDTDAALAALWEREMWTDVYQPVWRTLALIGGGQVSALVFEANQESRQFAGMLSATEAARYIATASGKFGTCREYMEATYTALQSFGFDCPDISAVQAVLSGRHSDGKPA